MCVCVYIYNVYIERERESERERVRECERDSERERLIFKTSTRSSAMPIHIHIRCIHCNFKLFNIKMTANLCPHSYLALKVVCPHLKHSSKRLGGALQVGLQTFLDTARVLVALHVGCVFKVVDG